jgi:hypothetical protein
VADMNWETVITAHKIQTAGRGYLTSESRCKCLNCDREATFEQFKLATEPFSTLKVVY